jgi:HK97 family phage major capsid protein
MTFEELSSEMQKSLHEFRGYVDKELKEIKANGVASPETKEAVERLNKRIDEIQVKMERPPVAAPAVAQKTAHQKEFAAYAKEGLVGPVLKSMSETGADGGYTVPVELDRNIAALQLNFSPMRQLSTVVQVSTPTYQKLVSIHGAVSGWVGETATRTATNSPQFAQLTPYMGELYAFPQVTQQLLDDSIIDIEQYLAGELADNFNIAEGTAFSTGDGSTKPKGFLAYTQAATVDGTRAFGTVQYVPTGVAADFAATNKGDILFSMVGALKAGHRAGSVWQMPKSILFEVRAFKDGQSRYLWEPSLQAGQPQTLLGYPVYENEDLPAKAAGANSIAFGNFKRAYQIVDRIGTRVLRDPFTNKPYVGFYATKRVGGMLVDSEAVKVLKFAVS